MANAQHDNRTAETIRRQAQSPATQRYAASLPQYRPVAQMPRYMLDMLKRLEEQEQRRN